MAEDTGLPAAEQTSGQEATEDPTAKGIHLYMSPTTYHSHRVVLALYEKGINFTAHMISLLNYDQFSDSYLKMNPKAEVPTLKNGENIIADSGKIIDYLDENYFCTKGESPRLIPEDSTVREKVLHFRELLSRVNGNLVYFGSVFHPQLLDNPKPPFNIPLFRQRIEAYRKNHPQHVREVIEKNPEYRDALLEVAKNVEETVAMETDATQFQEHLDEIDVILDEVEEELRKQTEDEATGGLDDDSLARGFDGKGEQVGESKYWLCGEKFTVADVYLASALERLNFCGYEKRYWENDKRPYLAGYYRKLQLRESYCKAAYNPPLTYKIAGWAYSFRRVIFFTLLFSLPVGWLFI